MHFLSGVRALRPPYTRLLWLEICLICICSVSPEIKESSGEIPARTSIAMLVSRRYFICFKLNNPTEESSWKSCLLGEVCFLLNIPDRCINHMQQAVQNQPTVVCPDLQNNPVKLELL